jgi:uncharacterized glyoxalase superfamily protein PhnB
VTTGQSGRVTGPSLTPSIPYDEPSAALAWLTDVLGFTASDAFHDPDGNLVFAQLVWGDGVIFISGRPPSDNPWAVVGPCSISLVADDEAAVERIHAQVVAAGGDVVREPHLSRTPLFPDGSYQLDVRDNEGNLWTVGTFRPDG